MTQVSRYGHMLKVTVNGMRMRVTARYRVDGSVLNDTIQGKMLGAETTLEIESPDPPDLVARVVEIIPMISIPERGALTACLSRGRFRSGARRSEACAR